MSVSLFSQFSPSGKDDWEKLAEKELKGRLKELSDWTIGNDLHIDPYATQGEVDPERMARMQACQKKIPGWLNVPKIEFTEPRKTNAAMKHALENGADAIVLALGNTDLRHCEFPKLLHGIKLSDTAVFFKTAENPEDLFREISKNAGYYLKGGVFLDPLAQWMRTGKPIVDEFAHIVSVLNLAKNMREFRPFMVEGHLYHNNGADPVQELAFMIAAAVECIDRLTDAGISPLTAFNRILFSVSIGTEFLTEIAKLRALRFLLRKISDAYQLPPQLCVPLIHAQTSSFYNADSAPYTNMIRSASQAMSAVIGGCNALTVNPYDQQFKNSNEFSSRISRNVSSVLNHESALGYVADPAAGSYLLETMSLQMADKAWEMFLEMEDNGGLVKCFDNGYVQKALKASLTNKINALSGTKVMIGVNKFKEGDIEHNKSKPLSQIDETVFLTDKNLADCYKSQGLTIETQL
ncbi:methylmalonyl-CoA mutase family protein [Dyadobacter sp. CY326]|uniref:methylmalonyl-CoA mutase family protein n=1 Tax=Dyadobacter sp. CY326 TaxID=2907300 RepID=UPI001F3629CF|nr:methylmalonyl-CoA mutase family protein [Dyadobacter sp. CY326]MCE7064130.1 methylmalonyl-CoA mutase family protein [Dyadobacter sp. CY326]